MYINTLQKGAKNDDDDDDDDNNNNNNYYYYTLLQVLQPEWCREEITYLT
jgi:hypothetical protein